MTHMSRFVISGTITVYTCIVKIACKMLLLHLTVTAYTITTRSTAAGGTIISFPLGFIQHTTLPVR